MGSLRRPSLVSYPPTPTMYSAMSSHSSTLFDSKARIRGSLLNVEPSTRVKGPVSFTLPFPSVRYPTYGIPVGSMREQLWGPGAFRREHEITQAAMDDEVNTRIKVQALVDLGGDEDVLEALGVGAADEDVYMNVGEVKSILDDLRKALSQTLEKERNGEVDVLKRRFLQKGIDVCEKVVSDNSDSTTIHCRHADPSSTSHSSSSSEDEEHVNDLASDYCSVSSLRFDEADVPVNTTLGTMSPPESCPENKTKSSGSYSKSRSWMIIRRAARKVLGKLGPKRS